MLVETYNYKIKIKNGNVETVMTGDDITWTERTLVFSFEEIRSKLS